MRFADHLRRWSPQALARLLAARPDLLAAADRGFPALARRATSPVSMARALIEADVGMVVTAEALVVARTATAAELDELLGTGDLNGVLDALERLAEQGLVVEEDGVAVPVGALSDLFSRPLGLGPSFEELARHLSVDTTVELARVLGAGGSDRPEVTVAAISRRLADPEGLAAVLADAPAEVLETVTLLIEQRSPAVGLPAGFLYRQPEPSDPLRWLLDHGLLVAVNEQVAELPREVVVAAHPDGLAPDARLRPVPLEPVAGLAADAATAAGSDAAGRMLAAAETVVGLARSGEVITRKDGTVGIRELRRLSRRCDIEVAELVRLLSVLRSARLIEVVERTVAATDLAPVWLGLNRPRRWTALVRCWLGAAEVASSPLLGGDGAVPVAAFDEADMILLPLAARRHLVHALAGTPPGEAVDSAQLSEVVVWRAPNLWLSHDVSPLGLIEALLDEARQLGLMAAGSPTRMLEALAREDRAATWVPGPGDPRSPAPGPRPDPGAGPGPHPGLDTVAAEVLGPDQDQLVVQSDLSAVALGPLIPAVAEAMSEMADREPGSSLPSFRFSPTSLREAFDRGWTAGAIEDFLGRHALSGVPQPLSYLITDVARRHGTTRVLPARSVVVTADEAEAVGIASSARATRLGMRLVAPTVLTSPVEPNRMLDELRAEGLFPVLDGATVVVRSRAGSAAPDRGAAEAGPDDPRGSGPDPAGPPPDRTGPPPDWTGPELVGGLTRGEIEETVAELVADGGEPPDAGEPGPAGDDGRGDLRRRIDRRLNRPAVVTHLVDGALAESSGVLVAVADTVSLLGPDGVTDLPLETVVAVEDPDQ
ncbi:MAG: helicase-associated domain-containing protein [Acidimicrobiales bacterium]